MTDEVVAERHMQLELLPEDLAGRVKGLQEYEFASSQAREHFEELLERLREQVAKSWFDQMSEALTNPDPEQLERVRQALDGLNRMIEQREARRAARPELRAVHGAVRRSVPRRSEGSRRAARAARCPDGGGPGGTGLDEPRAARPAAGSRRVALRGPRPALAGRPSCRETFKTRCPEPDGAVATASAATSPSVWTRRRHRPADLGEMDQLEQFLRSAASPGALAEVDLDQARQYLGDDGARSLQRLANLARELEDAGLINRREGRYELTAKAIRRIGQKALSELFAKLTKDRPAGHRAAFIGTGHEREGQTKPYEFGDPFTLHIERTVHNAVRRSGVRHAGEAHARGLRDRAHRSSG